MARGREQVLVDQLSGAQTGLRKGRAASVIFRPMTLLALLAVGLFSFAALIVLSGFADDLRKAPPGQATPRSVSGVGYKAFIDLLEDTDFTVRETRGDRSNWERNRRLVIYTPSQPYAPLSEALEKAGDDELRLIVLPKWQVSPMEASKTEVARPGWARKYGNGLMRLNGYDRMVEGLPVIRRRANTTWQGQVFFDLQPETGVSQGRELTVERLQYFDFTTSWSAYDRELFEIFQDELEAARETEAKEVGEDETDTDSEDADPASEASTEAIDDALAENSPATETDKESFDATLDMEAEDSKGISAQPILSLDGNPVLIRLNNSNTFVLSEPDLINTIGLNTRSGAQVAISIVNEINSIADARMDRVDIDLSVHGLQAGRNVIKLMLSPPFLAATLCLLAAGGLIAWQGFNRFGDPERPRPDYAQGPVSLARTAAEFMQVAGRAHKTGGDYAALIRKRVAAELGFRATTKDRLSALLESRERRSAISPSFAELDRAIRAADEIGYAQYARALNDWQIAMLNETPTHNTPTEDIT